MHRTVNIKNVNFTTKILFCKLFQHVKNIIHILFKPPAPSQQWEMIENANICPKVGGASPPSGRDIFYL